MHVRYVIHHAEARLLWRYDAATKVAGVATVGGVCKLEACGVEAKVPPSMAGEVLSFKSANAVHIEVREPYGFSQVAKSSGNMVGISKGYRCAVLIRTNSIPISADGAKGPPFSTVLATTTRRVLK